VSSAIGENRIYAITNMAVASHTATEISMDGCDSSSLIGQFDLSKLRLGWALGREIENAGRIGWTIELPTETANDFDLLVLFQRGWRRYGDAHTILAGVLHVAPLH